jgi:hypothetical protein
MAALKDNLSVLSCAVLFVSLERISFLHRHSLPIAALHAAQAKRSSTDRLAHRLRISRFKFVYGGMLFSRSWLNIGMYIVKPRDTATAATSALSTAQAATDQSEIMPAADQSASADRRRSTSHLGISARSKTLKKTNLRAGDVLMLRAGSTLSISTTALRSVQIGQALVSHFQPAQYGLADTSLAHSAMYVKSGPQDPEVVEAILPTYQGNDVQPGEYEVYRHKNTEIAKSAANTAKNWVQPDKPLLYPLHKAAAGFASSLVLGAQLNENNVSTIDDFAAQADDKSPAWLSQTSAATCSELTTAAYQAAAKRDHDATVALGTHTAFHPIFPTVAHRTLPSAVTQAMEAGGQFEYVGTLIQGANHPVPTQKDKED